jgi:hypothetical protein
MDRFTDIRQPYERVQVRNTSPGPEKQGTPEGGCLSARSVSGAGFGAWISTLWPLALHWVLAIGITIFMVRYVHNNHFGIEDRRPIVNLADGTLAPSSRYILLQSDIATILSSSLVVLRLVATAWAGPLCWRSVFLLLEKTGLRRRDLEWIINYKFLTAHTYGKHALPFFITTILLSTLIAQSASPIVTGSIAWTPSSILVAVTPNDRINISAIDQAGTPPYPGLLDYAIDYFAVQGVGFVSQTWDRNSEKGVLKRYLPSAALLNINSTIANVSLPSFSVTSLEWISDPVNINYDPKIYTQLQNVLGKTIIGYLERVTGALALLPDADWRNSSSPTTPLPARGTRRAVLSLGRSDSNYQMCPPIHSNIPDSLPANTSFARLGTMCLAFARVTYSTGLGVCTDCRISSPSVVRNDSAIVLQEDRTAAEVLRVMLNITNNLVLVNSSLPAPWRSIDDYVAEALARSYSGAWTVYTEYVSSMGQPLSSNFTPALPLSRARVDLKWAYAWLGTQLLLTLTGLLFLAVQSRSRYSLIGDTTLVAFDLDTSDVPKSGMSDKDAEQLFKIEPKDDGWKVFVDHQAS